jgi:hypothetical protein
VLAGLQHGPENEPENDDVLAGLQHGPENDDEK